MDESHPLLDRLEADVQSPPSLKSICLSLLRNAWHAVSDVGDAPYPLVADLLPLSTASQLAQLEDASSHIALHTNHIWRSLAVQEFIEVRRVIEDNQLRPEEEPASWREQYHREEARREAKMEELLSRMRGQLREYKDNRKTIERVDGVQLARARKAPPTARPKTLIEKARSNTKAITSIYAPGRRRTAATVQPWPALKSNARPSESASVKHAPSSRLAGQNAMSPPHSPPPDSLAGYPERSAETPSGSRQVTVGSKTDDSEHTPRRKPGSESALSGKTGLDERPLKRAASLDLAGVNANARDGLQSASAPKRLALSPPPRKLPPASSSRAPSREAPSSRPASFSPPPVPNQQKRPGPPRPAIKTVTRMVKVARPAAQQLPTCESGSAPMQKPSAPTAAASPPAHDAGPAFRSPHTATRPLKRPSRPAPPPAASSSPPAPTPLLAPGPGPPSDLLTQPTHPGAKASVGATAASTSPYRMNQHPSSTGPPPVPPASPLPLLPSQPVSAPISTAAVGRTPSARSVSGLFMPRRGGGTSARG